MDISYTSTGETINITKEFLDDSLGERDWNKVSLIRGNDLMYRNIGKRTDESWDFKLFARVGITGKISMHEAAEQLKYSKVEV